MSIECVKCRGNWNFGCSPASSVAQQHRQTQADTHSHTHAHTFSQFGDEGEKGVHIGIFAAATHSHISGLHRRSSAGSVRWNFCITWDSINLGFFFNPSHTHTHTHRPPPPSPNSWRKRGSSSKSNWLQLQRWRGRVVFRPPLPISRERVFTVWADLGNVGSEPARPPRVPKASGVVM